MDIQLGSILESACAMAGYDLQYQAVPVRWRVTAAAAVNEGLRRIHAEKFPALRRIEFRRYRPTVADLEAALPSFSEGQECWYAGFYWRRTETYWERVPMEQLAAFVAFDQPWEANEIDPGGVVKDAFAFRSDPKYNPEAAPIGGCNWFEDGVMLPAPAPDGVFVRFVPKAPRISFLEWSGETAYAKGAGCYVTADRECYVALADIAPGGDPPSANASWKRVRVRDEFETYLVEMAAATILSEDQGRYQTKAAAETEFAELQARFSEGLGDSRIRPGRFRR
jgi:hypothetical protein